MSFILIVILLSPAPRLRRRERFDSFGLISVVKKMEESVFAPYSNRNATKIAGCFSPETLVYGSASNVIVVRHNTNGASLHAIHSAHDW